MKKIFVSTLFVLAFVCLASSAEAVCCTAVEGVCSECCPGESCGCVYGHSTGRCICTGCDTEINQQANLGVNTLATRSLRVVRGDRVAVFLATEGEVVLMDPDAISRRSFDTDLEPRTATVSMKFRNLPAAEAVKLIATSVGFDVVLPLWGEQPIEGKFEELEWRDALETVMAEATGSRGRVEVLPNGLVQIAPAR